MKRRTVQAPSLVLAAVVAGLAVTAPLSAQRIFHSTQSANLQTTEALRQGNVLFEISHRFVPPIENGVDALWGLDGPANSRLGLAYAAADGLLLGVQRSNADDNLELYGKTRLLEGALSDARVAIAVMAGVAWNFSVVEIDGAEDNERQAYAQLIVDAAVADDRLALGVVPTWLRNPRLRDEESFNAIAIGVHGQWYLSRSMSLLGEWIFSEEIADSEHDSGTFGIEFETRGHFFKIVVTNQDRLQPTQYLAGSRVPFEADQLRLGFNITRLLPF